MAVVQAGGVGSTGNLTNTWQKDLENLWMDGIMQTPVRAADIVQMPSIGGGNHYVRNGMMISLGNAVEGKEGQTMPFDSFVNGPTKTVYPTIYRIGLQFTDYARKDDRYSIIQQGAGKIGEAMQYTTEVKVWDLFNSGFVTTTRTGIDSKALFATDHPLYGASGQVFDNTITGALTKSSLRSAVTKFRRMVNERNQYTYMEPMVLLYPPELEFIAAELVESELEPDTANNAINSLKPIGLQRMSVPFLTSTTAWFVTTKKNALDLYNYWFDKPAPRSWQDPNTNNWVFASEMRMATCFFRWRGVVGSTGV